MTIPEYANAHDSGDCIPEICQHPDHQLEDGEIDLTYLLARADDDGMPPVVL